MYFTRPYRVESRGRGYVCRFNRGNHLVLRRDTRSGLIATSHVARDRKPQDSEMWIEGETERETGKDRRGGFAMNVDYDVDGSWIFAGCTATALQPADESFSVDDGRCIGSPVIIFNALRCAPRLGNLP